MRPIRSVFVLVLIALAVVLGATPVAADAVYHTDRLALEPVGDAEGSGFVVNIHPNGPQVFAIERYALRGAEADESYTVWLIIDASQIAGCASLLIPMKVGLTTNSTGNATSPADVIFRPPGVPTCLRNQSFPIRWQVTQGGVLTHQTDWTIVTLD